jgi:hypothetical protein
MSGHLAAFVASANPYPLPLTLGIFTRMRSAACAAMGFVGLVVAVTGCDRSRSPRDSGTSSPAVPATAGTTPEARRSIRLAGWNDTIAGPSLFVAGTNASEAVVILPGYTDSTLADAPATDSALGQHPRVDLFSRRGLAGAATLARGAAGNFTGTCTAWPTATVSTAEGPPPDWSVAFTSGHAIALPMDSMMGLASVDSARRAAAIARAASALPDDTAAAFRGLPFAVRDAHQFMLPSGDTVLAAEVVRRLNQEASPQEEHLLIVLERDTLAGPGGAPPSYVVAYSERTSGPEDDVESSEMLAAVDLGRPPRQHPAIVIGRDYGDGSSYTLLERVAPRRWRARWNSAYVGC